MQRSTGRRVGKVKGKGEQESIPQRPDETRRYARLYAVVRRIPRGRVATYGQVAALAGFPGRARQAGYALHALPSSTSVPWQRVVNAAGRISPRSEPGADLLQRVVLESEGVKLDASGRISLDVYQWRPRASVRYGTRSKLADHQAPKPGRGGTGRRT